MTLNENQSKYSILLVDDEKNFRNGMKRMLRSLRDVLTLEVTESDNGKNAVEIFSVLTFDLVLMDYKMPSMDGVEAMKAIHAVNADIPIIIITGEGSEEVAVNAMKNGAEDYLIKGMIDKAGLFHAIKRALEKYEMKKLVDVQNEDLIEAERHRVMVESLGAACHHLGQPATVIHAYLEMLRQEAKDDEAKQQLDNCIEASERIRELLLKFQQVSEYRTVPYKTFSDPGKTDINIIDI